MSSDTSHGDSTDTRADVGTTWRRVADVVIVVVYGSLITLQLARHSMWRDEAQAWSIVRGSDDLASLMARLSYDGHPPLWYLFIWPFAAASNNFELIKIPVGVAAITSVVLVVSLRTLTRLQQVATLSGFLLLIGYTTISRSYVLVLVLVLMHLVALERRRAWGRRSTVIELACIVLLPWAHVLAAVPSAAMAVATVAARRSGRAAGRGVVNRVALVAGGWVVNTMTVYFMTRPPADMAFAPSWDISLLFSPTNVLRPLATIGFPARSLLEPSQGLTLLAAVVTLVVIVALLVEVWRSSPPFAGVLAASTVLLWVNAIIGYGQYWWHLGLVALVVLHVAVAARMNDGPRSTRSMGALNAWLALGVVSSIVWVATGASGRPYSGAEEAAAIVRRECSRECIVISDVNYSATPVGAYLGDVPIFSLNVGRWETYAVWDAVFAEWMRDARVAEQRVSWATLETTMRESEGDAVGVLSSLRDPPEQFDVVGETKASTFGEDYLIVRLRTFDE